MKPVHFFTLFLSLISACGSQQNTYREDAARANTIDAQLTTRKLSAVTGAYCGSVHLNASDEDFTANLELNVQMPNTHSNAVSPASTTQQPQLSGNMEFPVLLSSAGSANYSVNADLMAATGGAAQLSINYGDYDPNQKPQLNLPFTVPSHPQGNYGQLQGNLLVSGHIVGTWYSNSFKEIGSFDFALCKKNQGDDK